MIEVAQKHILFFHTIPNQESQYYKPNSCLSSAVQTLPMSFPLIKYHLVGQSGHQNMGFEGILPSPSPKKGAFINKIFLNLINLQ
jgi:hypothetical protein